MQIIGGLQNDPRIGNSDRKGMVAALMEARDQMIANGVPKDQAEWQISQPRSKRHQPGAVRQLLINAIRQNQSPEGQAAVVNAPLTPVPTGRAIAPTQFQPGAPGAISTGAQIPLQLPLGEAQTVSINPVTQSPMVTTKGPQGNV